MVRSPGPLFKFTPSVSFLVACDKRDEVDAIWKVLAKGGAALMELGEYPFSQRYGWTQDRYGLSWQVMLAFRSWSNAGPRRKLTATGKSSLRMEGKKVCVGGSRTSSVFPGKSRRAA